MTAPARPTEGSALAPGVRLGPYEVLGPIGSGGMGEVYRARDERLGRDVAVKVLPLESSTDPDRLRRFAQEAKAAGVLNHPNLVAVFDVGRHLGNPYVVFELLEGETLRTRLRAGALPLRDAIGYATQIASGLAAAHEKGIVHRDLKPENLIVTKDGRVKILDFGLAKLSQPERPLQETGDAVATELTTASGTILGTAGYMSPEQIRGQPVDHRSDVFSYGAVLYEMLCGRRAFQGETPADTLTAILRQDPPELSGMGREIPPALDRITRRCLEKDPAERFQSAQDIGFALEAASGARSIERPRPRLGHVRALAAASKTPAATTAKLRARRRRAALVGAALTLLVILALGWREGFVGRPGTTSAALGLKTAPLTSHPGTELDPDFSPDGRQLAFSWDGETGDNTDVYIQLIGAGAPLRLTTHPGADSGPAWSPDGRFIAFTRAEGGESAIYLVPSLGGPERRVLSLHVGTDWLGYSPKVDWSPDGESLVVPDLGAPGEASGLSLLSLKDLARRQLTTVPAPALADWSPAFSPDGREVAFVRWQAESVGDLHRIAVEGGDVKRLTFDEAPLLSLAWAPDGRGLFYHSIRDGAPGIWWMPVSGGAPERLPVTSDIPPLFGSLLAVSADGHRLAHVQSRWDENIWRLALQRTTAEGRPVRTKLIASTRHESAPQFSPDGRRIAFESSRSGVQEIWLCDSDGTNPVQATFLGGPATGTPRWSPDGRFIAFDARTKGRLTDIFVISAEGGPHRPVTSEPSNEWVPSWSRDGRFIYFASNRTGRREVWKSPAEGGAAIPVTQHGGFAAFESPDGRWVYFSKYDEPGIWRVPVGGGDESLVLDRLETGYWGYWGMTAEGLYFLDTAGSGPPAVAFYSFASGRVSPIATLDKEVGSWIPGLAVSPDGRSILYVQPDERGSDILLVEGFR